MQLQYLKNATSYLMVQKIAPGYSNALMDILWTSQRPLGSILAILEKSQFFMKI